MTSTSGSLAAKCFYTQINRNLKTTVNRGKHHWSSCFSATFCSDTLHRGIYGDVIYDMKHPLKRWHTTVRALVVDTSGGTMRTTAQLNQDNNQTLGLFFHSLVEEGEQVSHDDENFTRQGLQNLLDVNSSLLETLHCWKNKWPQPPRDYSDNQNQNRKNRHTWGRDTYRHRKWGHGRLL